MAKLTRIALGLLLMLASAVVRAESAGAILATADNVTNQLDDSSIPAARRSDSPEGALKAAPPLTPFTLKDQHGTSHTLGDDVTRLYYTRDMGGGKLMKKVFGENGQTVIDGKQVIAISNVSGMNVFIRNTMAIPALKKRPYTIWIDDTGVTDAIPYKEDHVTVLDLDHRAVTNTRFIHEQNVLKELSGLAP